MRSMNVGCLFTDPGGMLSSFPLASNGASQPV